MWYFEVYKDGGGLYRWRLRSANGQIVANSDVSFASRSNAERAAEIVKNHAAAAPIG